MTRLVALLLTALLALPAYATADEAPGALISRVSLDLLDTLQKNGTPKGKREIIAFRRDGVDPLGAPAPAVPPSTLKRWLDRGMDDHGRPVVLLDTRNREEVAHGSFAGAITLPIDDFVALPEAMGAVRDRLAGATVVSFCTGGIRCEKAAPWLRSNGYGDVRQLEGGILGWFEAVGGAHWQGACFVFDERVALGPDLRPIDTAPSTPDGRITRRAAPS